MVSGSVHGRRTRGNVTVAGGALAANMINSRKIISMGVSFYIKRSGLLRGPTSALQMALQESFKVVFSFSIASDRGLQVIDDLEEAKT